MKHTHEGESQTPAQKYREPNHWTSRGGGIDVIYTIYVAGNNLATTSHVLMMGIYWDSSQIM